MRSSTAPTRVSQSRSCWQAEQVNRFSGNTVLDNLPFVLVVFDRDTGEVTVQGSLSDDRRWNTTVIDGPSRNLRCFALVDLATDAAAAKWYTKPGSKLLPPGSVDAAGEDPGASLIAAATLHAHSDFRWLWRVYVFTTVYLLASGVI
jgi:hypothetical protein